MDVRGEDEVDVGEDGDDDQRDAAEHDADGRAALGAVLAVVEHGGQHVGGAEQELLHLAGEHGAGALEHELEQDLDADDFERAGRAEDKAADELRQVGEVEVGERREHRHREAEEHEDEGDGAEHGGEGELADALTLHGCFLLTN